MNKSLVLSRLWATIAKLLVLEPEKFNYQRWVTEGDHQNGCGTVCCVAGWYPVWFKKAGLEWFTDWPLESVELRAIGSDGDNSDIKAALVEYHGIPASLIECLFFGSSLWVGDHLVKSSIHGSLDKVTNTFKKVAYILEAIDENEFKRLDYHLNPLQQ